MFSTVSSFPNELDVSIIDDTPNDDSQDSLLDSVSEVSGVRIARQSLLMDDAPSPGSSSSNNQTGCPTSRKRSIYYETLLY